MRIGDDLVGDGLALTGSKLALFSIKLRSNGSTVEVPGRLEGLGIIANKGGGTATPGM